MLEFIKKDITTVERGVVAHGVNCQGVMGAGVALSISNKWPRAYLRYIHQCGDTRRLAHVSDLLGCCDIVTISDELYVANLYTQLNYGRDKKAYANVTAIDNAIGECVKFCLTKSAPLYLPRIGCGLGGLNWEREVEPIISKHSENNDVQIYVCDL